MLKMHNWYFNFIFSIFILYYVNIKYEKCFPHSWYLANDMQFYWLASIIIIPFSLSNKYINVGYVISGLCMLVHIITNAVLVANIFPEKKYFNYIELVV